MSIKTPAALSPEELVRLCSQFDPEEADLLLEVARALFTVDTDSRRQCGLLARGLLEGQTNSLALARLVFESAIAEAQKVWKVELSRLPLADLRQRLSALDGPILWGIAYVLAFESCATLRVDHALALEQAELAVETARSAPRIPYLLSEVERQHLEALAVAFVANVHRSSDRTPTSRKLFEQATEKFRSADPLSLLPIVLFLRASKEISERDYLQALRSLEEAESSTDSPNIRAQIHLKRAIVWGRSGETSLALQETEQALSRLDSTPTPDAWLHYCATQNRAAFLSQVERFDEATALLPTLHEHLARLQSEQEALQVRWVEARIAIGQGRAAEGEDLYRSVRQGFLHLDLPYRAAVATVELARHLYQQGRFEEVARLAAESVAEFRCQGVEQEVIGAVALLEDAHRGQLSLEIVGQILKRVRRAEQQR